MEKIKFLLLPGIEPRFLGRPIHKLRKYWLKYCNGKQQPFCVTEGSKPLEARGTANRLTSRLPLQVTSRGSDSARRFQKHQHLVVCNLGSPWPQSCPCEHSRRMFQWHVEGSRCAVSTIDQRSEEDGKSTYGQSAQRGVSSRRRSERAVDGDGIFARRYSERSEVSMGILWRRYSRHSADSESCGDERGRMCV
jgi:hypothetical protein